MKVFLSKEWFILIAFILITFITSFSISFINSKYIKHFVRYVLDNKPINKIELEGELPLGSSDLHERQVTLGKYVLYTTERSKFHKTIMNLPNSHYFIYRTYTKKPLNISSKNIYIVSIALYLLRLFILISMFSFKTLSNSKKGNYKK